MIKITKEKDMLIVFRNIHTQSKLFSKELGEFFHVPRHGEAIRLDDGRISRVMEVEYSISKKPQFAYDSIEVFVEIFEKEAEIKNPNE
jgi:hypothetical protein